MVPSDEPATGTLIAPGRWPAANSRGERTSSTCVSARSSCSSGLGAPTNGPRLSATTRSTVGGFGAEMLACAATNSSSVG